MRFFEADLLTAASEETAPLLEYRVYQHFMQEHDYDEISYVTQLARFLAEVCWLLIFLLWTASGPSGRLGL
jgi:hypothetical protein